MTTAAHEQVERLNALGHAFVADEEAGPPAFRAVLADGSVLPATSRWQAASA